VDESSRVNELDQRITRLEVEVVHMKEGLAEIKKDIKDNFALIKNDISESTRQIKNQVNESKPKIQNPAVKGSIEMLKLCVYVIVTLITLYAAIKYPHVSTALKSKGFIP